MSIANRIEKIESRMRFSRSSTELDGLSEADVLRIVAKTYYPSGGNGADISALNPDEQGYWVSLWITKPNPDDWDVRELCMFDELHYAIESHSKPWPDNHRFAGIGYVEMVTGIHGRRIKSEGVSHAENA